MTDSRSPSQLGKVSAQRVAAGFPEQADPEIFLNSSSYDTFLAGRKFDAKQQKEFERAYRSEYTNIRQAV